MAVCFMARQRLAWAAQTIPPDAGPDPRFDPRSLDRFADALAGRLNNKCVGFQIAVSYREGPNTARAGGEARRPQDGARPMTSRDRINVASISKTVTAAGMIHAMLRNDVSDLETIHGYLPRDWEFGQNIDRITFRQLMQHTAGFRGGSVDYAGLREGVRKGIAPENMGKYEYNNVNYALMRILLPRIAGLISDRDHDERRVKPADLPLRYSQEYMGYCQRYVFTPSGIPDVQCKPAGQESTMCYRFPKTDAHGTDFGDMTLTNAERGWTLSAEEIGRFLRTLHFTNRIFSLDDAARGPLGAQRMRWYPLGYDFIRRTPRGVRYSTKNGMYPGDRNPGHFSGAIYLFENGISAVALFNSEFQTGENPYTLLLQTFDEVFAPV